MNDKQYADVSHQTNVSFATNATSSTRPLCAPFTVSGRAPLYEEPPHAKTPSVVGSLAPRAVYFAHNGGVYRACNKTSSRSFVDQRVMDTVVATHRCGTVTRRDANTLDPAASPCYGRLNNVVLVAATDEIVCKLYETANG